MKFIHNKHPKGVKKYKSVGKTNIFNKLLANGKKPANDVNFDKLPHIDLAFNTISDALIIKLAIPGFNKDDSIEMRLVDSSLIISGKKNNMNIQNHIINIDKRINDESFVKVIEIESIYHSCESFEIDIIDGILIITLKPSLTNKRKIQKVKIF